jgi:POT family proton-dependent oligopeptide transporter
MTEITSAATVVPKQKSKYPKAVPYIIGNEAAERFSFYGMRSILVTFLVVQAVKRYQPLPMPRRIKCRTFL